MFDIYESIKKECFRRRLSDKTAIAYTFWNRKFFRFCSKDYKSITKKDVKNYITYLSEKNLSASTLNLALNSIRFMLFSVMHKRWHLDMKYSKKPKKLPGVLVKEEVLVLIDAIDNPKHKLIAELMYSAGLRVSEVVNLRVRNLDIENSFGWVRHGKGDKDRIFIIAEKLKNKLAELTDSKGHDSYLFRGRRGHLTTQSVYQFIKKAAKKAKLKKNVHPHTLRHSFGTHIVENEYSLQALQGLLGHSRIDTTKIYVHTAKP